MAIKGYCTAEEVADFLGREFTAAQWAQCEKLIERAENFIDNYTGWGWLMGARTDEAHYLTGAANRFIFLRYAPVSSVSAITGRTAPGETETTLTANDDYEVRDLESGQILLISGGYDRVLVDYTPVSTVPGDLEQAIIELVSTWLGPQLQPGSYGLDSFSLPDLTVKFSRAHVQEAIPPTVESVLDRYRYRVHA